MISISSQEEFLNGVEEYEKHEKRDSMYKVSTFFVSHFWGRFADMADGLGVLLLTWNQAFYRYGVFDFDELEQCIDRNFKKLEDYRNRDIFSLTASDEKEIKSIFNDFLDALKLRNETTQKTSPVAVAKALHILAPNFFPLWDKRIAEAYGLKFKKPAEEYFTFCKISKYIAEKIKDFIVQPQKPILRLIDQYNYAKYTKEWI
jgi:hypothetical protein